MSVALVTGASRGIGAAIAQALAEQGWDLCINYLERQDLAETVAERLRAAGRRAIACRADVADPAAVRAMFDRTERELGAVSLLVNNAGVSQYRQFQDISAEEFQRVMSVNVGGCFNCMQAALPHMLHRHEGCIINISSVWGSRAASCETVYAASKHAVEGLSRSLAVELAPSGIRVNCVAPGVVDTDMLRVLGEDVASMLKEEIPLHKIARPEDIARAVLGLVENNYVTAQTLVVDGGYIA